MDTPKFQHAVIEVAYGIPLTQGVEVGAARRRYEFTQVFFRLGLDGSVSGLHVFGKQKYKNGNSRSTSETIYRSYDIFGTAVGDRIRECVADATERFEAVVTPLPEDER